jgi:outer membrane protein TolC
MVKRRFFPKVNLYAKYSYYGSDEDEYYKAFDDIREKNYSVGLNVSIPLVQNLKRMEELSRIDLERKRNKIQMEEAYDAIKNEYDKISKEYSFFLDDIEQKKRLLRLTRQKMTMLERLTDTNTMELESALEERLRLIERELELEKQIIERQTAIKHILIRVEGTV